MNQKVSERAKEKLTGLFRGIHMIAKIENIDVGHLEFCDIRTLDVKCAALDDGLHAGLLQIEFAQVARIDERAIGEPQRQKQKDASPVRSLKFHHEK